MIDALTNLFFLQGVLAYIRPDTCPKVITQAVRNKKGPVRAKTAYIEPGSPWENGYCESFSARFREKLRDGEIFYSLQKAQILIEHLRTYYNTNRAHSALGYRPPAPETSAPMETSPIKHCHSDWITYVGLITMFMPDGDKDFPETQRFCHGFWDQLTA